MGVDSILTGAPEFDKLELVKKIKTSITKPAATTGASLAVPHGLGYVPIALVYFGEDSSSIIQIPYTNVDLTTGIINYYAYYNIDDADVNISLNAPNWVGNAFRAAALTELVSIYLLRYKGNVS